MAEKQNHKERLKEITDGIETGIMELFESDKYKSYLQTMSRFHKYSLNNTLLISMQKSDTALVAGFNKWRDGFSRFAKKAKHSILYVHNRAQCEVYQLSKVFLCPPFCFTSFFVTIPIGLKSSFLSSWHILISPRIILHFG